MPIFNDQSHVPQDKPVYPLNVLGKVAAKPFYIWANEDCSNKSDSFEEAKAIRMELYNDAGTSVHIVDADGVEVVDAVIEAHEALANAGYFAGARKPDVKPEFPGAFMVNDPQDPDGFAIVGDDIAVLILEARDHLIEPAYEREVSINTDQRLEKLQALGFDSESDYRDHHRVLEASRDMAARQKADSIAAGSTAFNDRKVPSVRAIEALALLCQADGRAQAKGRFAELVGMSPDRFVSEVEGGHLRVLADKLAARFSGAAGALMQNDLNSWLAGLGVEGDNAIPASAQARTQREVQGSVTGNGQRAEAAKKILGLDSKGRAFQWADELVELVNQLSAEYESWCKEQKVPYIRMDDQDAKGYYLTQAQRAELAKFRERWNALEQAQVDSSNRSTSMKLSNYIEQTTKETSSAPEQSVLDKGVLLRTKALALLQEAQALDGLKPFTVTHTHSFGESTYVLWAAEKPTLEEAEAVLDSEFEPDREETLAVEDCFTLEEMSGVAVTARLPDILESLQSPGQDDSPSP